jgi:hypothetical protein
VPITLDEPRTPGPPVVKRQQIGERFIGALVKTQQRDVLKDGKPALKDDGKARQELVLTLVAMPGTTCNASIGDKAGVPNAGDVVRLILRGGGFGDWIEARKSHGELQVGDVVEQTIEYAQAYVTTGSQTSPTGPKLTTQEQANAVPRSQSLGFYGPLSLRRATPEEGAWVTAAEAAYHEQRNRISAEADSIPDVPF